MKLNELEAIIEAILFVSGDSVALTVISDAINMDKSTTKAIIKSLSDKYDEEKRGIHIVELDGSYQMCTAAFCFDFIKNMYKNTGKQGLSQTLLESLAIVAYKQPVTKQQIEEIRGVNADHAINKLVEKGLVAEIGRMDAPGKPILFGTTKAFLRYFGFSSTKELPALEEGISLEDINS